MAAPAIHVLIRDDDMLVSIRVPGDKTFVRRMTKAGEVLEDFRVNEVIPHLARISPGHAVITAVGRHILARQTPIHEMMSRMLLDRYQSLPDDRFLQDPS